MKLYPKKLGNIKQLEREKKRLLKKAGELGEEEFLSFEGLLGKAGDKGSWVDLLQGSNPLISLVVKRIEKLLSKKNNKPKKDTKPVEPQAQEKPGNNKLRGFAKEFIGGYLKWKAIELSFKGIGYYMRKRKEEKEERPQL